MNRNPRHPGTPWRPQGAPFYLARQGRRLGLSTLVTEHPRVKDNRQLARISGFTAEVCLNYFNAPRPGGPGAFADWQLANVRASLSQCEHEIAKTFAVAAAAVDMADEAYAEFGMEPPGRPFRILVVAEPAAESAEVAALKADAESLRAEVSTLRASNESLAERLGLRQPAAPARPKHPHSPPG